LGLFALITGLNVVGAESLLQQPPSTKAEAKTFAEYVGSASCRECHPVEYQRWAQSPHGLAERSLRPEMDRPAFEPSRSFKHGSQTTTVRIQNGEFQIVTLGFKTNVEPYRVERVIGQDPIRQFLTPAPGGRWQVQEVSYAPQSNQWFDVYGEEDRRPGEWGHWTGRGMNWNSRCAECHNTCLKKNYDAATDSYHTTMAERSVSCEACHGSLKAHIDWQQKHPHSKQSDSTVASLGPARILDTCGSCHSRQRDLTGEFKPGDLFFDHYSLEILDHARRWYPDGQVQDEDYEFASFLSSRMSQAGVTCLDCHTRDVRKPQLQGNDLCLRCHNGGHLKAPVINPAEHGHHKLNDKGGECVGCHMPVTVYMQRHPRHDHGFIIPDPLLTKELGIPNACNRCHADQTKDWALKYTDEWYGTKMNRPSRERARWIAAAENGEVGAKDKLIGLLADTNQSSYWCAVAATFLEQWANDPAVQTALLAQLKNDHPLVRERVVRSLEPVVEKAEVQSALKPMLNDPLRNVRVAAAWVLRRTVDMKSQAGRELQQMLDLDADQPTGQFEEAMLLLARQQPAEALAQLKKATAWDPLSPPFLCTQAQVQDQLGQLEEALKTLNRAEAAVLDDPHIPYVRAMILARNGRYSEARTAANRSLAIQRDFQPALELLQQLPANH
jgi:tetratricopeptide (TPR) repeat protein